MRGISDVRLSHVREGASGGLADTGGAEPFLRDAAAPAAVGDLAIYDDRGHAADAEVSGAASRRLIAYVEDGDVARVTGDAVDGRDRFLTEGAASGEDFDGACGAHEYGCW